MSLHEIDKARQRREHDEREKTRADAARAQLEADAEEARLEAQGALNERCRAAGEEARDAEMNQFGAEARHSFEEAEAALKAVMADPNFRHDELVIAYRVFAFEFAKRIVLANAFRETRPPTNGHYAPMVAPELPTLGSFEQEALALHSLEGVESYGLEIRELASKAYQQAEAKVRAREQ